jgi:predicted DNA binding CopG/RHH family protein
MLRRSTNAPRAKSEPKEADWYASPQGRRQTEVEFTRAIKAGTLIRARGSKIMRTDPKMLSQLMEQAMENATRAISIRVPIADLERAKQIAARTGVGYQVVLKKAIREGLKRAG